MKINVEMTDVQARLVLEAIDDHKQHCVDNGWNKSVNVLAQAERGRHDL